MQRECLHAGWRGECAPAQQQCWDASGRAEAGNNSRPTSQNTIAGTIAGRRGLKVAGYADRCACMHACMCTHTVAPAINLCRTPPLAMSALVAVSFTSSASASRPRLYTFRQPILSMTPARGGGNPERATARCVGVSPSLAQLHRATVNCIHTHHACSNVWN
jgi:hypothetical protein